MKHHLLVLGMYCALGVSTPVLASSVESLADTKISHSLSLEQIIQIALEQDGTKAQLTAQTEATLEAGLAKATLMDPTIKLGVGGLPTDSFRLDQDPMTNLSVGLMQKFDRGNTTELQSKMAGSQANISSSQIAFREREIITQVTQLWLELGYARTAEKLLHKQHKWLSQLVDNMQANYSLGLNESQDIIASQLKVSQLEQKIIASQQQQQALTAQLSEWLGYQWLNQSADLNASNQLAWQKLTASLSQASKPQVLQQRLLNHPMVLNVDASIEVAKTQVEIADQAYSPQFGVEVMYAHRQANNMKGEPAPDMVSAFITMDLPIFTDNKQDRAYAAAQHQVGAAKSMRDATLARLSAQLQSLMSQREHTLTRLARYKTTLVPQSKAQQQAVERGYQNNSATFSDIVTSSINQLSIELEQQRLITDLNLINNQLSGLLGLFDHSYPLTQQRENQ
ncbi:TolC family protein [Vibrio sp. LaRot3]|uniref:TolC family protein n=1 Tax=Vibrio sp. LaRot3 TaxID=2998829 RepID=UPI0022CE04F8|nr:TolC family protein [Vibrio sp. LaRot3]MDA0147456.1 TolC family protein [Vibrio sp. LaRot3]